MSNIVSMYGLTLLETQRIGLPKGAEVLSVCVRHEQPIVAVKHDVNGRGLKAETESFEILILGEKRVCTIDKYKFLGTIVLNYGNDIYNVFYRKV